MILLWNRVGKSLTPLSETGHIDVSPVPGSRKSASAPKWQILCYPRADSVPFLLLGGGPTSDTLPEAEPPPGWTEDQAMLALSALTDRISNAINHCVVTGEDLVEIEKQVLEDRVVRVW